MVIPKTISTISFKSGYPLGPGGVYLNKLNRLNGCPYPPFNESLKIVHKGNKLDYFA